MTWEQQSRMFQLAYGFFQRVKRSYDMSSIFYVHDVDSSSHMVEGSSGRSEELETTDESNSAIRPRVAVDYYQKW